jgi:hypothetical protein
MVTTLNEIGDVQVARNDLAAALSSYRDSLAIMERLTKIDDSNTGWQHDLAVGYGKLADVYRRNDDRDNELAALRQAQTIMGRLVALSPDNADWKRDKDWFDGQIAALTK